jgi:hypothetical protein
MTAIERLAQVKAEIQGAIDLIDLLASCDNDEQAIAVYELQAASDPKLRRAIDEIEQVEHIIQSVVDRLRA